MSYDSWAKAADQQEAGTPNLITKALREIRMNADQKGKKEEDPSVSNALPEKRLGGVGRGRAKLPDSFVQCPSTDFDGARPGGGTGFGSWQVGGGGFGGFPSSSSSSSSAALPGGPTTSNSALTAHVAAAGTNTELPTTASVAVQSSLPPLRIQDRPTSYATNGPMYPSHVETAVRSVAFTPPGPSFDHGYHPIQNPHMPTNRGQILTSDIPDVLSNVPCGPTTETPTGATEESPERQKADASMLNKILHSKLINITSNVEVERRNPNSPLYSVKTFEELHLRPELLKGVYQMGFTYPSKIQETALPTLLADPPQNMIAQSQSGTGKTASFVLAALSRVRPALKVPQVLCLSPTYELALQTGSVFEKMARYSEDIIVRYAIRGVRVARGDKIQEQVVIGTPGTVLDWLLKFRVFDGSEIRVFILDEADVMIAQQGHQDQSIRIHKLLSSECQMLLFSATYEDDVMEFAEAIIAEPVIIRLKREEETLDNIKQYFVECSSREEKYRALCNIYGVLTIGQSMIFCQTRATANWLAAEMTREGHAVALLSGELEIEQRASIIKRFREGKEKVLVSTNVTARGIDVEQVTIVVNFDLPLTVERTADYETYLHRIGRTGRFGKAGIAINFLDSESSRKILKDIESHFGTTISVLDTEDIDEIERIGS